MVTSNPSHFRMMHCCFCSSSESCCWATLSSPFTFSSLVSTSSTRCVRTRITSLRFCTSSVQKQQKIPCVTVQKTLISTPKSRCLGKKKVHPLVSSTSSPFKRAHLCSNVSILWRSCSQASRCWCWEADMVVSSFSRSFSSTISNCNSLLCRWTVEPVRSFQEHFDRSQSSETSQNTLERQIQHYY